MPKADVAIGRSPNVADAFTHCESARKRIVLCFSNQKIPPPPPPRKLSSSAALAVLLWEFLRYAAVGAVAFLVDFGVLVATQEFLFGRFASGVYLSTVCGFIAGLVVNYVLSLLFVFTRMKDRNRGRSVGAFLVFGVIGLIGLLWTELGMWLGVAVLEWDYRLVKVFVTAAVLLWNYLGRKLIIFR